MCGILGQINRRSVVNTDQFRKMLQTLEKRGPDQSGVLFENNVALGHQRLSIIDLSDAGRQPMENENRSVAVIFNGEIYNYKNVAHQLKLEHRWKSRADTEVLVHGYEEYGQDIARRIEGMFAYAIYDKERQKITLARDHFGKKPLYYYLDDDFFCFASELKAIIANEEIRKKLHIDSSALTKYLFYGYIPSPHSIFDRVKKLEPSTTFQFDLRAWKILNKYCYWNLENIAVHQNISEKEILEKTEFLIREAVEKRLMSDVPLGIFLSGGVDSGLLATYLSQRSSNISAFTVRYARSSSIDESVDAERIAKKLNIKFHLQSLNDVDIQKTFRGIMDYLDEPMADPAIIPLHYIAKASRPHIIVALSGDGGDEIFGGYAKYKVQKFIEQHQYFSFLARLLKNSLSRGNQYYKFFNCFDLQFSARQFILGSGSFLMDEVESLLQKSSIDLDKVFEDAVAYEKLFKYKDSINKSLFMDCKIQLPDWYLVKGDRATMATSLEMRNPLLDKTLAEFIFSLEGEWKIRRGTQKYILKKLAEKYLDKDIIYKKKSGFWLPIAQWIRSDLKELFEAYLFQEHGYFNTKYIRALYNEHCYKEVDHSFKLLRIFNFNYWYKGYYAKGL